MSAANAISPPAGWVISSLGECAEILAGVGFSKHLQGSSGEEIPVFKVGDISRAWKEGQLYLFNSPNTVSTATAKKISSRLIPPDTIVFAKIGAAIGLNRRAILGRTSLVDNNVMGLSPHPNCLVPKFLFYFVCTVRLEECSRATTVPSIRKGDVAGIRFYVPPLSEQRRIVESIEAHLTRLDAAVETLKRVQANLKRYRASVLKAAVEGRLVPTEAELARREGRDYEPASKLLERILVERRRRWEEDELANMRAKGREPKDDKWRTRYKEPAVLEMRDLPNLPKGWCWASVDTIGDVLLGRQRAPQYLKGESPRPYLRVANIKDDRIDLSDILEMDFSREHFEKYRLRRGDILVSEGQSPERVGQSAIYLGGIEGLCFQKTLHRFRPIPGGPSSRFAQIVFRAHVRNGIFQRVASITTNIAHLTLEKFKSSPFPLPSLAEQSRIEDTVDDIMSIANDLERQIKVNLDRIKSLRQSILKWAFEGKLVDQNPNDEPASALLDRIKAEREGSKAKGKGGKGKQLELAI